jgi:ribosomal protein S8E
MARQDTSAEFRLADFASSTSIDQLHILTASSFTPTNTKLGAKRIHAMRVRGGNTTFRALRLDTGNFAWGSEHVTRKPRIIDVVCFRTFFTTEFSMMGMQVYNTSNNELVRANTSVKGAIIQVDAAPLRQWYEAHVCPIARNYVSLDPLTPGIVCSASIQEDYQGR